MKRSITLGIQFLFTSICLWAIDPNDTRLMSQPSIGQNHIAFIYAQDLWVANLDGSQPRRLTVDEGVESNPHFSPDGKTIAFTANYDGNADVFVVPVEGGIPKRLTYHPYTDQVVGFTPKGEVLFVSARSIHTNRYVQFFAIGMEGGLPRKLIIPFGTMGSYSPDGKMLAYTPNREVFRQWKNYRGGTVSRIWLFHFADHEVLEIPKPQDGSNDTHPIWLGEKVYFLSDREGEFNLFSYETKSKKLEQLTRYKDFPIFWAKGRANTIIFEQGGFIHLFDIKTGKAERLKIGIATDLLELRPRYASGNQYIRSAELSPSGKRAIFDFRGDILTVPEEKGFPKNLTQSPGAHEKHPVWSPDGSKVAYFSDESGEYQLHIQSLNEKDALQSYDIDGSGFYAHPHWSPDGKHLAFVDNGRSLYLFTPEDETLTKIDQDEKYFPGAFRDLFGDWYKNSRYLVYTKISETNFERIFLYDTENEQSYPVSDEISNASSPAFDASGKYLYFLASTDAGPVVHWFAQSNNDMELNNHIYLATLQQDLFSPFAKESDEEESYQEEQKEEQSEEKREEEPEMEIDIEGLQNRIIDLPLSSGMFQLLKSGQEGQLYYHNRENGELNFYDINKRENKVLMEVQGYTLSADRKKMLYVQNGNWFIKAANGKSTPGKRLNTDAIKVKIDPQQEWPNMFAEAWRVNRDYFYDPGMHGVDWKKMKKKYEVFLPHLACRSDLNRIIQWMCSELGVGHHRIADGGDYLNRPERIPGGLLGADYTLENGRYRLAKIYGGLNWNPGLVSPLTEPGVNAREGEYLLAIDGEELTYEMNIHQVLENTAGRIVEITLGPSPDMEGSRTVRVSPIAYEGGLRNRYWVEENLQKVKEATKGQVAYVYVPNTAGAGHQYFKRYFFPQVNKKAIIVDERYNGGGQISDYYIDLLLRPYQAYWNFRYGQDLKTPSASIKGPKVLIVDENAGSGGDMFPWMFRKFEVGTIVGKRTWGGLVGVLGFPEFIDGGSVTAPNVAIWTKDGFIVENEGVAPDIEVEQYPKALIEGRDPQLEKAIEVIMDELEKNPPQKPKRPPYPNKMKK